MEDRSLGARIAQFCILIVIATSIGLIFTESAALGLIAGGALTVYFVLCWRHFTSATWVTIGLCVVLLAVTLVRGLSLATLASGLERMAFLAAFLALLGTLRSAASEAPEIIRAGRFLTAQPPGRRFVAMNCGGHIFGLLINLGGLAVLLEMTRRSLEDPRVQMPPDLREWKLRRMTTATLRGFSLIPLWSPFGLGMNVLLLSMPGLAYWQVAPLGMAAAVLFFGWGWFLDWLAAPRGPIPAYSRAVPDPSDGRAVFRLLQHVLFLAVMVLGVHHALKVSFQSALLLAVPAYSLVWAAVNGRNTPAGSIAAMRRTTAITIARLPAGAAEIGVFASAGLLSVLALEVLPIEMVQTYVADLIGAPWQMVVLLTLSMFVLATAGLNPIISASVLGSLVTQLHVPGLSDTAAALCLAGTWSCVMGFTPLMTTVAYAGALIGRPPALVGLRWNGIYCLTAILLWTAGMALVVQSGVL